jgi:sugar lactone lactonase YvrE
MIHAAIWDDRACILGEGPLWHPERRQLFWFDIATRRLLSRDGDASLAWDWDEIVSAAGWIDRDTLMVAGETALWRFDIPTGDRVPLAPLDADDLSTRSNDGRADPVGGFWIGTMGKAAEPGRGAIHRYFRGEVRTLYRGLTIPNAIAFHPEGKLAYFADTAAGIVWRQVIDRAGWPSGRREVFADLSGAGLAPDGAVCDADGNLWIAQWGAGRVACHGPDGRFVRAVAIGAALATCPAFGGARLDRLYVTSARQDLPDHALAQQPGAGLTWIAQAPVRGMREFRVVP